MVDPVEMVSKVYAHGVELRVVGDRVQCRPVERLPRKLRYELHVWRAEIAAYLRYITPTRVQ